MPASRQTGEGDSTAETRAGPASPSALASMVDPVAPGERVGRFIVLEPLGQGGMGLVWSAFDPKLDRKVALKFLRTGPGEEHGDAAQARLLREAQALARLSHPNVVAVHDVDTHRGRVFVAMELVVGQTMREWLRQPRSWRETLRALVEAGRGVAAAHRAGIIHRDIKPSNILVGTDGRARVSDFGLARPLEEQPTVSAGSPMPEPGLEESVTEEGHVVGTREYMSPEQAAGRPVDARSDVFSFCVTAYEALCGVRPSALAQASRDGDADATAALRPRSWRSRGSTSAQIARLPAPAAGRRPPRRLIRRLARGLQANPNQRWEAIPPLLDALEKDARPLRPWHVGLVAALAIGAAAAGSRLGDDSCAAGAAGFASAWRPSDRSWLVTTFAAVPEQPEAAERAARFLDAYSERWQAEYRQVCRAMGHGAQARQQGAIRLACLEARRQDVAGMMDHLHHASARAKSLEAVLELPGISACGEAAALSAPTPPPDDGPMRQRIDELTARLARVTAEDTNGDPRAGPDLEVLIPEVDKVGFAPLQAAAYQTLGAFHERTGNAASSRDAYFRSVVAAERGHAEAIRSRAACRLAFVLGHYAGRYDEADRWLEVATAIATRTGLEDLDIYLQHVAFQIRLEEGRMPDALASLDRMEALLGKRTRADDPARVYYYSHRSDAFYELGRIEESVRFAREALAYAVDLYGEQHPGPARLHYLLSRVLVEAGQASEARDHLDVAVRYWSASSTSNPLHLLDAGDIRATSYQVEGRYQEALDEARRTLALREKSSKEQADFSFTLDNIGMALIGLGRSAEAIPPLERSLAIKTAAGMGMISSAEGMLALARALWESGGDKRRARKLASDAEEATRIAPLGRVHREAADWLAAHP